MADSAHRKNQRPRSPVGRVEPAILAGELDLSEWDDDELLRGQRRSHNGKFQGRPPKVVPTAVHQELVRRRISRAGDLLDETLEDAVALLGLVIRDPKAQYADRIKAAGMVMDRVMGKSPERVHLEVAPPWALALESLITAAPLPLQAEVIEAEVWEDSEP